MDYFMDVRYAVCGNVDSGKSTFIGVLTRGILDDGRGKTRVFCFNFKHETETGRTSSIGQQKVTKLSPLSTWLVMKNI